MTLQMEQVNLKQSLCVHWPRKSLLPNVSFFPLGEKKNCRRFAGKGPKLHRSLPGLLLHLLLLQDSINGNGRNDAGSLASQTLPRPLGDQTSEGKTPREDAFTRNWRLLFWPAGENATFSREIPVVDDVWHISRGQLRRRRRGKKRGGILWSGWAARSAFLLAEGQLRGRPEVKTALGRRRRRVARGGRCSFRFASYDDWAISA